ncbi:MAG: hypothetical protein LKG19_11750 [Saprospiraceae bacterium]|jgi:hypothetical protein|nr:hypothetical protein [Saprospiraceae bacterium]
MIIIQFDQTEIKAFESIFDKDSYDPNYVTSKQLGGAEIFLQVILTVTSVVSPYIIEFFKDQKKKKKQIKVIKEGVELTFESEDALQKYLDSIKSKDDK